MEGIPLKVIYAPKGMFELMDWTRKTLLASKNSKIKELADNYSSKEFIQSVIRQEGTSIYGTKDINQITSEKTQFLFSEESEKLLEKLLKRTNQIDVSILNQKKNIIFNDRELGIFSFDLASLGLIPVVEYYSSVLNSVVNPNMVRSEKVDGKTIFYHIEVPFVPEHKLVDKGTHLFSPVLGINIEREAAIVKADPSGEIILTLPQRDAVAKHQVEQRQVLNTNGSKKFSSTNKKSFIFLENIKKNLPQIDIILSVAFSWKVDASTQMLYNSLPVIALLKMLEKNNVKFRLFYQGLTGLHQTRKNDPSEYSSLLVKLKDLNDSIDYNMTNIVCSDGRFFRYETFQSKLAAYDILKQDYLYIDSLGYPVNDYTKLVESFNTSIRELKDFGSANPDTFEGDNDSTKVVFPASLSEEQAFDAYEKAVNKIKTMLS